MAHTKTVPSIPITERRLLTIPETAQYLSVGYARARELSVAFGAIRRFGHSVLVDRVVLDKALDELGTTGDRDIQ